jgi:hypothetical protein
MGTTKAVVACCWSKLVIINMRLTLYVQARWMFCQIGNSGWFLQFRLQMASFWFALLEEALLCLEE